MIACLVVNYSRFPTDTLWAVSSLFDSILTVYVRSVINAKRPYLDGTLVDPTGQWTGRSPQIFYSASVIWGLVGPARFFDGKYKVRSKSAAIAQLLS